MADQTLERLSQQEAFVKRAGWIEADLFPLPSDASFRRYTRLKWGEKSALLMDAPPEYEDITAYLKVTSHLARLGLSVPHIYAENKEEGFALIEDFGEDTFTRLLDKGVDPEELYSLATDVLKTLHAHPEASDIDVAAHSANVQADEVMLLLDWFLPLTQGVDADDKLRWKFYEVWLAALSKVSRQNQTLVLRDYHVDNLMILSDRKKVARCGLLDYQDAVLGSPAYDLVSLIEDARRDVPDHVRQSAISHYTYEMNDEQKKQLFDDMAILGAQRHTRVLGVFARLSKRDDKHHYLIHLERVQRLLLSNLEHPLLAEVKDLTMDILPNLGNITVSSDGNYSFN